MLLFMIPGWSSLVLFWFSWLCKHLHLPDSDAIAVESTAGADPLVLPTPSVVLLLVLLAWFTSQTPIAMAICA